MSVTERLFFSLWCEDDVELAQLIWGDPAVMRFTGGPLTNDELLARLVTETENWRTRRMQYWPLFDLASGQFVGCCGLRPYDDGKRIAELGFYIRKGAWGQGFAIEAATAVIDYARRAGLEALLSGHHPENAASKKIVARLGFTFARDEYYGPTRQLEPCYQLRLAP